jgi:hypothetical protein
MKPEDHIRQAEQLCRRLRNASTEIGSRDRSRVVQGADPNELKKILTFLMKNRDMNALKTLINKLPGSNFAQRSGSTFGYYRNIQSALGSDFYKLSVDDAINILGWACRLL